MLIIYLALMPVAGVFSYCYEISAPSAITCGINEEYAPCRIKCPPQSCNISYTDFICPMYDPCEPGCNCIKDHLRNNEGICVFNEECPPPPQIPSCGDNEVGSTCRKTCPPDSCDFDPTKEACKPGPCQPGCNCIENYLRDATGKCVPKDQCPKSNMCAPQIPSCGDNEVGSTCRKTCPPDSCDFDPTKEACKPGPCQPGCNCIENYLRDATGKCIPKDQCPKSNMCVPTKKCEIPYKCRRTCAEPNPPHCPAYSNVSKNVKGCKCKPGSILSQKDGECVRIEDCPQQKGCNGDNNAHITKCPAPCPSTCQSPNQVPCKKACLDVGCACNDGHILSELNGKCIKPDDCPGGNPCGRNATFRTCNNRCPYNYCPVDDSPPDFSCVPPTPCPSGCVCNLNYRKKSIHEDKCILASECTPVNCRRRNEIWSPCPSACLREDCENAGEKETVCNTLVLNCQPQCICKPNTFRNENKICVPVEQCPKKTPQPYD